MEIVLIYEPRETTKEKPAQRALAFAEAGRVTMLAVVYFVGIASVLKASPGEHGHGSGPLLGQPVTD